MTNDCELDMTTIDLDYFLETGEEPVDMAKAFETLLALATKRKGIATCLITIKFEEEPVDGTDD